MLCITAVGVEDMAGVVDYNRSMSRVRSSSTSTTSSRRSRVDEAQEEAREAREEARQAREEARQTREQSQQALAYMSSFMEQLRASFGPDVNIPQFCPPVFTPQTVQQAWTQPQRPPAWTQPRGPQMGPQGSQMPPQGFQPPPMGWMQQGPYWVPGPGPNYGPWIRPLPHVQVSGSHPGNVTPDAEIDPNEYLRNSVGGSGSGHNSNNPQS
ncbi:hypothetical protein U9M48_004933 [Paspalum notatum var. saurae]|uniref:Uncharacterized protein n=1 Tax=Paspalum notatum var. saurae TaxID=547442 RepID=A0AAQ3SF54_PASNO